MRVSCVAKSSGGAAVEPAARGSQPGAQLPGARAHPVDAEEQIENGAGERQQPASGDPTHGAARVGLGEQGVYGSEDGAEHVERNDQQPE